MENSSSAKDVRVLCWVMTSPQSHREKAIHIQRTWGQRCDKLLFMSSEEDSELNSVALNVEEGHHLLWAKTKEAFKYVYKHHLDDADWFLKADDDTYVIVENLRFFLKDFDSENPIYFGSKFKLLAEVDYLSGGAGYVLSKEVVKRLVENGLPDASKCRQANEGYEDIELGKCLLNLGIEPTDTRDAIGRYRFFPFNPEKQVVPRNQSDMFWIFQEYPHYEEDLEHHTTNPSQDADAVDQLFPIHYISERAISFHYVTPKQMYFIDHLLYHLRLT